MHKFLRKNNKRIMAVFGVFLMIAFAAQSRYGAGSGSREAMVIGKIGADTVTAGELDSAKQQWHLLTQALVVEDPPQSQNFRSFIGAEFPPAQAIDQDPKAYLLLLKEADRLGVGVSDQAVQDFLSDPKIDVQLPTGSIARFDQVQTAEPDYALEVRQATAGFLSVLQAGRRAMDLCKLSRPLKDFMLADNDQNMSVRFVAFDAGKLPTTLPTKLPAALTVPTTQQLQQQFDQFASILPSGSGSDNNPFGFGYKIPDQLALQTISFTRQQLKDAVHQSKSDYEWDVLARGYYLKHKSDYPATQPIAPPPSAMVTLPTTQPASPFKSYEQVKSQMLDAVMASDVDDLADRVQKEIVSTLSQDWASYQAANPATQPTTESSTPSSLTAPYASYDYFKALAAKVQKDFSVLPAIAAFNKPMSEGELPKLAGIGHAQTTATADGVQTPFQIAATNGSLAILQPSPPLSDNDSTVYLFRVTSRIPAHAPASMADVAATVLTDWRKSDQWKATVAQANALRDAAAKSSLTTAAAAATQLVVTTPPFSAGMSKETDTIPTVPLEGEDVANFKDKCQTLLAAAAQHQPPLAVVEAPNESKVLVIELANVQPNWPSGQQYVAEAAVARELLSELSRPLEAEWYSLSSVQARLGYVEQKG
jgi:hypothetical protein